MMGSSNYSRLPYWAGLLLPWPFFTISFGVDFTWYKLMPVVIVLISLVKKGSIQINRRLFSANLLLSTYLILAAIVNCLILLYFSKTIDLNNITFGVNYWLQNGVVQLIYAISISIQIMFMPKIAMKTGIVDRVFNGYIHGCIISVAVGLVLLVLFGETRMTGLAVEPRHFSAVLVPAIFLILVNSADRLFRISYSRYKLAILFFGLLASLSSSSLLACFIGLIVFFVFGSITLGRKVFFVVSILIAVFLLSSIPFVQEFFGARNQGRLISLDLILYFVPKDALAIYFFAENWLYLIFGVGPGAITLHTMQPEFLYSLSNPYLLKTKILSGVLEGQLDAVLAPSSFIISYVANFGVLGLLFFVFLVKVMIKGITNSGLRESVALFALMVFCACAVLSTIGGTVSIFFLAIFYAEAKAREQKL